MIHNTQQHADRSRTVHNLLTILMGILVSAILMTWSYKRITQLDTTTEQYFVPMLSVCLAMATTAFTVARCALLGIPKRTDSVSPTGNGS